MITKSLRNLSNPFKCADCGEMIVATGRPSDEPDAFLTWEDGSYHEC